MLALVLAFSLIAVGCGGGDDDSSSESSSDTTSASSEEEAPAAEEEAEEEAPAAEEEAEEEVEEESAPEPVSGGTLRWGLEADVDGINPTASALSAPGLTMSQAVFDSLVVYTKDGDWACYLCETFTSSDDLRTWTMKLRSGVTFHDGTPLNAEAIRVNFEAQRSDPLVGLAVKPFFPKEDATTIIDDLTIAFNLSDPDAWFPTSLTGQLGYVASPTWLAAAKDDPTLDQKPVGTGPFAFDSRSEDSVTKFVRNENWWNGAAYLDAIEFLPITDPAVRTALLLEGELGGLATTNIESIIQMVEDGGVQNFIDDNGEESFVMLNTASAPFDDLRARQALTHATPVDNYNLLINLGEARVANQIFTPDSPYYNPDIVQLSDKPALAGPLVESYCADNPDNCSNGNIDMELQFSGPSVIQTRISELLVEGWEPFFNVTIQELPQDQHIQQTAFGLYNALTWRQFGAVEMTRDKVWLLCRTVGGISLNWPRYCDEERDQLIFTAEQTTDESVRIAALKELSVMINEAYTYIFFNHTMWDMALAKNVHGLCDKVSPSGFGSMKCIVNGRSWFDTVWISE
jgi:peptide/nickel transport system substrate-binding protein